MSLIGAHKICQRCLRCLQSIRIPTRLSHSDTKWKSKDVRKAFLDFFCQQYNHEIVSSSKVIPKKGEGVYFTNAGMNQFKHIFLGTVPPGSQMSQYRRVTNSQKCIRVGGKHNDLEDVGRDLTHHTFFEMLGSWSFGDYFKREACQMALRMLTEVYGLPQDRLYFTYYGEKNDGVSILQPDLECQKIWQELGIPESRILPFGKGDNFWDMGDIGPCGRCTEIHYDHVGGRDAARLVNTGSPEVVELWNLVFMEFDRQSDQVLTPLRARHVDTGMGLERLCAVLTGTRSNYNTDLFLPIFQAIQQLTEAPAYRDRVGEMDTDGVDQAYRTVADHIRMMTVCISDGLMPGREELDVRLRMVMNRCMLQYHNVLYGKPGQLSQLVDPVVESLGDTFPEIQTNYKTVKDVINHTEKQYLTTLKEGKKTFQKFLKVKPNIASLSGQDVFDLVDGQFGSHVPVEVVTEMSAQHRLAVDMDRFQQIVKEKQGENTVKDDHKAGLLELIRKLHATEIPTTDDSPKYDYEYLSKQRKYVFPEIEATVLAVANASELQDKVSSDDGENIAVILNQTPFYAEAGGQGSDKGHIKSETGKMVVTDTQSHHGYVIHTGYISHGNISSGQTVTAVIDKDVRKACMRNHTATHLVHSALRRLLPGVKQRGSSITPEKFVFEFSCVTSVSTAMIAEIEVLVRNVIENRLPVQRLLMPLTEAQKLRGVAYLEDEVYPNEVSVISVNTARVGQQLMGQMVGSMEFCGGTHVRNTEDLGDFCVISLAGVKQGTKRVVCMTGEPARQAISEGDRLLKETKLLENLVKNEQESERWVEMFASLTKTLGDSNLVLPKSSRDQIKEKLKLLNVRVNSKKGALAKVDLKTKILDQSENQPYVVLHTELKTAKQGIAILKTLTLSVPVALVINRGQKCSAVISLPQNSIIRLEQVCEALCAALDGEYKIDSDSVAAIQKRGQNLTNTVYNKSVEVLENLLVKIGQEAES